MNNDNPNPEPAPFVDAPLRFASPAAITHKASAVTITEHRRSITIIVEDSEGKVHTYIASADSGFTIEAL